MLLTEVKAGNIWHKFCCAVLTEMVSIGDASASSSEMNRERSVNMGPLDRSGDSNPQFCASGDRKGISFIEARIRRSGAKE